MSGDYEIKNESCFSVVSNKQPEPCTLFSCTVQSDEGFLYSTLARDLVLGVLLISLTPYREQMAQFTAASRSVCFQKRFSDYQGF